MSEPTQIEMTVEEVFDCLTEYLQRRGRLTRGRRYRGKLQAVIEGEAQFVGVKLTAYPIPTSKPPQTSNSPSPTPSDGAQGRPNDGG